jgi:hypothetical protein
LFIAAEHNQGKNAARVRKGNRMAETVLPEAQDWPPQSSLQVSAMAFSKTKRFFEQAPDFPQGTMCE